MPWKVRWTIYMIVLGAVSITVAIIAEFIAKGVSVHLLAIVGMTGGLAIILNALPHNGTDSRPRDYSGDRGGKSGSVE